MSYDPYNCLKVKNKQIKQQNRNSRVAIHCGNGSTGYQIQICGREQVKNPLRSRSREGNDGGSDIPSQISPDNHSTATHKEFVKEGAQNKPGGAVSCLSWKLPAGLTWEASKATSIDHRKWWTTVEAPCSTRSRKE